MKKIIVAGATSCLGISIIEEALLHDETELIYAVIRKNSVNKNKLPDNPKIKIIECDMSDYSQIFELINDKCDAFYCMSWDGTGSARNKNILIQAKNIIYYLNALRQAKKLGCKKFIGAGSQAEYGKLDIPCIDFKSPVDPIQSYGVAKYAAGKLCMMEAERLEIECYWVRIFSCYGKHDKETSMVSSCIRKLLNNEPTAFSPAEQLWDYLYSEDAGKAFYLIGKNSMGGSKTYCLGSGESHPLREYIYTIRDVVAPNAKLGIGKLPYSSQTPMNLCADISLLSNDTGWKPQTSFKAGIKKTVDFMKKSNTIN